MKAAKNVPFRPNFNLQSVISTQQTPGFTLRTKSSEANIGQENVRPTKQTHYPHFTFRQRTFTAK